MSERFHQPNPDKHGPQGDRLFPLSVDSVAFAFSNLFDSKVNAYAYRMMLGTEIESYAVAYTRSMPHLLPSETQAFMHGAAAMRYAVETQAHEKGRDIPDIDMGVLKKYTGWSLFQIHSKDREPFQTNDIRQLDDIDTPTATGLIMLTTKMKQFDGIHESNAYVQGAIETYRLFQVNEEHEVEAKKPELLFDELNDIVYERIDVTDLVDGEKDVLEKEKMAFFMQNYDYYMAINGLAVQETDPKRQRLVRTQFLLGALIAHSVVSNYAAARGRRTPEIPKAIAVETAKRYLQPDEPEEKRKQETGEENKSIIFPLVEHAFADDILPYEELEVVKQGIDFGFKVFEVVTQNSDLQFRYDTNPAGEEIEAIARDKVRFDRELHEPERNRTLKFLKEKFREEYERRRKDSGDN